MSIRPGVLLMTSDSATALAVSHALSTNGHVLSTTSAARDFPELLAQLSADPAAVALVDIDPNAEPMLAEIERAINRFPTSRFVALSASVESDLLLDAMQAGVRRVVAKEAIAGELPDILNRLSPPDVPHTAADGGRVISLLSASGGCGATTVAANLANEIAIADSSSKASTLLIDLDCIYGAIATYFGLAPQHAADHILHSDHPLDMDLIRASATVANSHLHVISSPASLRPPRLQPMDFCRLGEAIALACHCYPNVIIDAPRLMPDVMATLVADSDAVVLLFQLAVKDLRTARGILDTLDERGVPREHVIPVANRFAKSPPISLDDAARVLGVHEVKRLRNDYASAIEGVNAGKPLSQIAPTSPFRLDLIDLLSKTLAPMIAREA